jgi:Big-like domain-containing protein/FG-GAP repeat protein
VYGESWSLAARTAPRRSALPLWLLRSAGVTAVLFTAVLVTLALLSPAAGGGRHGAAGRAGPDAPTAAELGRLPVNAQAVISTALGADRPISAARAAPFGYTLQGGGVSVKARHDGVGLSVPGGSAFLALQAVGRGHVLSPLAAAAPAAHGNRVLYRRGAVVEWYAAGPLGVEQGFTIARRPRGGPGSLLLATRVAGSLAVRTSGSGLVFTTRSGAVALRYRGLQAVDARGRRLPATLALRGRRLLLRVDDRGARYPVTVDPLIQQGTKLTANGATSGTTAFGSSLAVSQDGSTALVGGPGDSPSGGGAWVFANVGGVWVQQARLTPTTPGAGSDFGAAVALSANGDVALIGDWNETETLNIANVLVSVPEAGSAWIFTRTGGTWSAGTKIVPTDEAPTLGEHGSFFGHSVALSDDGTTAVIGGWGDNTYNGAAWIYSDASGPWTEVTKISGPTGETAGAGFAQSVAISGDGNTALMATGDDNAARGAAWVYTRSGTAWNPQGGKIIPSDESGSGHFGSSVALSQDGNTSLIGGSGDGAGGAAWVFARSGATWSQQGHKLTPSGEINVPGSGGFGSSVALSADGNTALIGAPSDFNTEGAAWLFVRSGSSWSQRGSKVVVNTVAGDEQGAGAFGSAVGLSGDAVRALVGGSNDNSGFGAVWAFNQTPQCANVAARTPSGGGTVSVTLSCTGPEGQPLSYAIAGGPRHGGVGSINQATGAITYVSQPGFIGTDTFTYTASGAGGTSQPATVTVTVPPFPPTCQNVASKTPPGGGTAVLTLSCQASPGVAISYSVTAKPGHGTLSAIDQTSGNVDYVSNLGFHGTDQFTYVATDSGGRSNAAHASITIPKPIGTLAFGLLGWTFQPSATFSTVQSMTASNLPIGTRILVSCKGHRCRMRAVSVTVTSPAHCKRGVRGCSSHPKRAPGGIDLSPRLRGRRLPAGSQLFVRFVKPGFVGKVYVFKIRPAQQPSWKATCLAPGSLVPGRGC